MQIEKKHCNGPIRLLTVLPLVLVFAELLSSNPVPALQAITPGNHQATAEQEVKQGVEGILATITQSRSTNTRGYEVVIHNDGSATAEIGGANFGLRTEPSRSQQFPPGTIAAAPAYRDWGCQQDPDRRLREIGFLRNAHANYVCEQDQWRSAMHPTASIGRRSGPAASI